MIQQIVITENYDRILVEDHKIPIHILPVLPDNEIDRALKLYELNLNYDDIHNELADLSQLAAKVAGTSFSMVNLIDSFTQWTVSSVGLPQQKLAREESICQYTILKQEYFEVMDLLQDNRFNDLTYAIHNPFCSYYFGVPIKTNDGFTIGTLAVMDRNTKKMLPEKIELLQIIAKEMMNRIVSISEIQKLKRKVVEANESQKRVAHDIRGPLSGIISLAQCISEQGNANEMDQVLAFISLIQNSGKSLLELADEILKNSSDKVVSASKSLNSNYNLLILKDKLEKLYTPQAYNKNIFFEVSTIGGLDTIPFSKNKLLQIIGNLVSNAIKFTPENGHVAVELKLSMAENKKKLYIQVKDSGIGFSERNIRNVKDGELITSNGTNGELGHGFGLSLVKHLVEGMHGSMSIASAPGKGSVFEIGLPQF